MVIKNHDENIWKENIKKRLRKNIYENIYEKNLKNKNL